VTVELWQKATANPATGLDAYYVKVLYVKPNVTDIVDITPVIIGCEQGCSLDQFAQRSQPYYKEDPAAVGVGVASGCIYESFPFLSVLRQREHLHRRRERSREGLHHEWNVSPGPDRHPHHLLRSRWLDEGDDDLM